MCTVHGCAYIYYVCVHYVCIIYTMYILCIPEQAVTHACTRDKIRVAILQHVCHQSRFNNMLLPLSAILKSEIGENLDFTGGSIAAIMNSSVSLLRLEVICSYTLLSLKGLASAVFTFNKFLHTINFFCCSTG